MPIGTIKLLHKEIIASGTMAFYFEKPDDFEFEAGQYLQLSLIAPPETDDDGNTRTLSIAAAPYEKNLMLAMRLRDKAFKRVLKNMPIGTEVNIDGPFGNLILNSDVSCPVIFLVGGIGITPIRSILKQAIHENKTQELTLFYSNRIPEETAFLEELQNLQKLCQNFKLVATMTQLDDVTANWTGERGYINDNMLNKYIDDFSKAVFYVVGSLGMVMSMTSMLRQLGIKDDRIRYEEFIGY